MTNASRLTLLCAAAMAPACFAADATLALRDPYVPPQVLEQARTARTPMTAASEDLRGQVERKLRESFDAADIEKQGSITREQAAAARLGIVALNFDAIDTTRRGRVSFEDLKRFLRARGARTL